MKRRNLLKLVAPLSLSLHGGRLLAAPRASPRLLLVFLRGGYDAASLLVPISSNFYYEVRPDIAVSRPSSELSSSIRLSSDWGLHPALRDTVFPLFDKGEALFIPFAGTDDVSRSHFETQDSIELGQPAGGVKDYRSGFLNRLAAVLNGPQAIGFTDQLPLILQGTVQVANSAVRSTAKPSVDSRQSGIISAMYQGSALAPQITQGFSVRDEVSREMAREMDAASRSASTAKGFELEARRVARLMKDHYGLGFIDVGGWDTHVNQGAASGYLASRFEELGRGLSAFAHEMEGLWRETTVVVISEFGRTFRQNGNRGTDHGHGTVFWVLGGNVKGGRVVGDQVTVEQSTMFQNRDYPVLNEYRAILAELFSRLYGLTPSQTERVFTGVKPRQIGLV